VDWPALTSTPAMRVKSRRVTTCKYDELEHLVSECEEILEPVEKAVKAGEFEGDVGTQSLAHGSVPGGEGWRIFKVYEMNVIWVRRGEEKKHE
jgi:hypothetical protein